MQFSRIKLLCLTAVAISALNLATLTVVHACTGFVIAKGDLVLAGNNEDYWDPDTKMWFVPATEKTYGRVYFGFANGFPQGGMNDKGLFFDGFATAPNKVRKSLEKPKFDGLLLDEAMSGCATVEEVIDLFGRYNLASLEKAMLFFADSSGDAVIIEGDEFIRKSGPFQIVTNFYQSKYTSQSKPCPRYNIAHETLSEAAEPSVELCQQILAATHAEGKAVTLYSNVYDLKKRVVYLYHFHNFENVVVIDLDQELKKGERKVDIESLFPKTFAAENFKQSQRRQLDQQREARRFSEDIDEKTLAGYVGSYKLTIDSLADTVLHVTQAGGKLYGHRTAQDKVELIPESKSRFFHMDSTGDVTFQFERDGQGKVVRVVCERAGNKYVATRID